MDKLTVLTDLGLVTDLHDRLGTEALDLKDGRVGVVLDQTNDLVIVLLFLFREREDLKVESLIDL